MSGDGHKYEKDGSDGVLKQKRDRNRDHRICQIT
jgi:hypothetical protein